MDNPYLLREAEVVERVQESPTIFTLRLRFTNPNAFPMYCAENVRSPYCFDPGQFNMLYLYGVGEVPISIVSDPEDELYIDHTIRTVGRVTKGIEQLRAGDRLGVRGPFGRGWPVREAEGRDVLLITGGLGCAPLVSVINYVMKRRTRFGRLNILQGVKHCDDMIWREQYQEWGRQEDVGVHLACDVARDERWPWHIGSVLSLLDRVEMEPDNTYAMMCGPEGMMRAGCQEVLKRGVPEERIFVSMERNMQCGVGHCGHCQHGGRFICKDGPVFPYPEIKELFGVKGF